MILALIVAECGIMSAGGGLKASATAQSAQLRPVVQSANVMHQQSSSQLMTPTNLVHGPSIMQPLNNSPHNLAVASQPSTASGLQQASPMVSARQPDTEPIDLTDD